MRAILAFMFCAVTVASAQSIHAQDSASEVEAVKPIVGGANAAVNAQKLDEMLAFYADDAKIDSKAAARQVSKQEYGVAMKTVFDRHALNRADVTSLTAKLTDATHATVDGTVYIHLTNGNRAGGQNQWKLEKREGRWLIVETKYQ